MAHEDMNCYFGRVKEANGRGERFDPVGSLHRNSTGTAMAHVNARMMFNHIVQNVRESGMQWIRLKYRSSDDGTPERLYAKSLNRVAAAFVNIIGSC